MQIPDRIMKYILWDKAFNPKVTTSPPVKALVE